MLANFHTHSTFSDGKNTPEELINYAIEKGFCSLGFSDHGFVEHDQRYCMQDTKGYIAEIKRLKEKYKDKIQIYLGAEEDTSDPVQRENFEYIISSLHYVPFQGKFYVLDSNYTYFSTCAELFQGDDLALAKAYYEFFCEYLIKRKPDVIGHFDLVTKFDEKEQDRYLHDERYWRLAEESVEKVLKIGSIFEVNTGLITRGYRTLPCPHTRLLERIAKKGGKITLSSDSHQAQHLCAHFQETEQLLKDVGFDNVYLLYNGTWQKRKL